MTILDFEYKEQRRAANRVCAKAKKEMEEAKRIGDKVKYYKASRKYDVYNSTSK